MAGEHPTDEPAIASTDSRETVADAPRALNLVPPSPLGRAAQVNHFVVFEVLGQGGMATVYGAYDTKLDRKVAVKVVRADRAPHSVAERDRLLREARAMARLAHPNVVTVLEVGEIGEDIFIALEYVEGTTLRRWLRDAPRTVGAILAAFLEAGRGLAAVHAAGLVHGDFKPDNVLVRRDGRLQLTDFGAVTMLAPEAASTSEPSGRWAPAATRPDVRVGSPAYMAPEHHAHLALDARADQFAFCVSLWEALYKQRPFAGKTTAELAAAIQGGRIEPVPRDAAVPRWIEEVLRRGLAREPADRWPDLTALLGVLGHDRAGGHRRAAIAAGVAALVVGSLAVAWLGWTRRGPEAARCTDAARHLAGAWGGDIATELRARFAATGAPFADSTARRVDAILGGWTRSWTAMRIEACEATAHGEQSPAMLDARMQCLDRRRDELAALTTVLRGADRGGVAKAVAAASHLPDVSACGDREALAGVAPLPREPAAQRRIIAIRRDLARAEALRTSGQYRAGRALATATVVAALAADHPPVAAEALVVRGELEADDGAPKIAEATLREAVTAAAGHDERLLARCLVDLVGALESQARSPEALALGIAAEAAVARVRAPRLEAALRTRLGHASQSRGEFAAAEGQFARAAALLEATVGPHSVDVAEALNLLGGISERQGQPARARAFYDRAIAAGEAAVGADHPTTAVTRANLCHLDFVAGELARARTCQEQVAATLEAALGPDHPTLAWALNDVALIQQTQGDLAGARPRFERALAIWERASGPNHSDVVWPLVNLGQIASEAGDDARAARLCRRAVEVVEATSGRDHPDLGFPLACLGQALVSSAPAEAVAVLRRALARFEVAAADPTDAASTRFVLARALQRTGERGAAIVEARAARDVLANGGPAAATELATVTRWLRANGVR